MNLPDDQLLAAIDIGSNSIHLIIARIAKGALLPIQRYRERVQLALGLDENQYLDEQAIRRGLDCLERMGKILRDHNPDKVRVVATYTLRQAVNRDRFLDQAESVLGYDVEVIAGREEARLIFQGVAHLETLTRDTLIVDVGGGSTEIALGKGFDPYFRESCHMGCVNYSQRFFMNKLDRQAFAAAHFAALQEIERYFSKLQRCKWHTVYFTSGSAKALEKLSGQNTSVAGFSLKGLIELREQLILAGNLQHLFECGVSEDRALIIPGGLAIVIAVMESLGIGEAQYRDVALREGVLYEMEEQMRHPDIRMRTRQSLQALYQVDIEQARRVAHTCDWICDQLEAQWRLNQTIHKAILLVAAHLYEVGLQIGASGLQKHSAYILLNSDLPGYDQDQQALLATLIRYFRKRFTMESLQQLRHVDQQKLLRLIVVLRFAVIFNITRETIPLQHVSLSVKGNTLKLLLPATLLDERSLLLADLQREQKYLAATVINLEYQAL